MTETAEPFTLHTTTITHTGRTFSVSLVTPDDPDIESPYLLTRTDGNKPHRGRRFRLWRNAADGGLLSMVCAEKPFSAGGIPDRYFREVSPGVLKAIEI